MSEFRAFIAYPSNPKQIDEIISDALRDIVFDDSELVFHPWTANRTAGQFLTTPILDNIAASNILIADVTSLNFNVSFEIGYAIGLKKSICLIRHDELRKQDRLFKDIGIFETIGYEPYANTKQLVQILLGIKHILPLPVNSDEIKNEQPAYLIGFVVRIIF